MARRFERVVYVIVDGMSPDALEQVIASGRAPAFAFLKERAGYVRDGVAVFPTITPAATASLVTGVLPARHGIPGMSWYDRSEQRFVNYGQSPRVAVLQGTREVMRDFLVNLNTVHLRPEVPTIHDRLDELGLVTASINYMVFRGPEVRELDPGLFSRSLFRKKLPERLPGPREHYFADVLEGPSNACSEVLKVRGLDKRISVTDAYAACVTRALLEREAADFVLFYLHENDHRSHKGGPQSQVDSLATADGHLAAVLGAYGSWEETADRVGFVVTTDHSQSPISNDKDHIVDLGEVLDDFKQARPQKRKQRLEDNELAVCGNGRVAFLYLHEERRGLLEPQARAALERCPGIDQIMWRDGDHYWVSSERGRCRFKSAGQGEGLSDERDEHWIVEGDLEAIGGVVDEGSIRTPEYPLALWRIRGALDLDRIGDLVVTMKLTWGCCDLAGGNHRGGGDHASLHAQDSLVPFFSTLADPPLRCVATDAVPHIVSHFEAEPRA